MSELENRRENGNRGTDTACEREVVSERRAGGRFMAKGPARAQLYEG